jgi:hypothetical protein
VRIRPPWRLARVEAASQSTSVSGWSSPEVLTMAARPSRMWASQRSKPEASTTRSVVVAFAQLTNEVGDRTASTPTALHLEFDEGVRPPHQAIPGVEAGEEVTLAIEDAVVGGFGHSAQQVGLVVEVVVELAARCGGPGTDLIQAGPERALLGHDLGGRGHDALSGLASPLGGRLRSHGSQVSRLWT